jgi:hypothetical protein
MGRYVKCLALLPRALRSPAGTASIGSIAANATTEVSTLLLKNFTVTRRHRQTASGAAQKEDRNAPVLHNFQAVLRAKGRRPAFRQP